MLTVILQVVVQLKEIILHHKKLGAIFEFSLSGLQSRNNRKTLTTIGNEQGHSFAYQLLSI